MITRMLLAATLLAWSATAVVADDAPPVEKGKTEAQEKAAAAKAAGQEKAEAARSKPMPAQAKAVGKQAMSGAGPSLAQLAVCTNVEDRAPVGAGEQFSSSVGELWCFTKVMNADAPTQIFHRWYVGEKMVNEIPINVGSSAWRCWSTKTILPDWSGRCKVEIVTESGDILGEQEFMLTASARPTPPAPASSEPEGQMVPGEGKVREADLEKSDG